MQNSSSIPVFRTDASIGKSILSVSKLASIVKDKGLKKVAVLEDSEKSSPMTNVVALHDKINPVADLCFGFLFKTGQEEKESHHKLGVFMLNDNGWTSLCQINNIYMEKGYVSAKELSSLDLSNNLIVVPFYQSFLFNNLFVYGSKCLPDIMFLRHNKAIFFLEDYGAIFDGVLTEKIESFVKENGFETIQTHTVLYEKPEDCLSLQVFRCSQNRTTLEKPNLNRFSHDSFCLA